MLLFYLHVTFIYQVRLKSPFTHERTISQYQTFFFHHLKSSRPNQFIHSWPFLLHLIPHLIPWVILPNIFLTSISSIHLSNYFFLSTNLLCFVQSHSVLKDISVHHSDDFFTPHFLLTSSFFILSILLMLTILKLIISVDHISHLWTELHEHLRLHLHRGGYTVLPSRMKFIH